MTAMARRMLPSDALTAMRIADGDLPEPPPLQPRVEPMQPLIRPGLPPPEWRAAEREAAERNHAPVVHELEPPASLQTRPAGKRAKPTKTPNLDQVRSWKEQSR
jgi:hypothetical protein